MMTPRLILSPILIILLTGVWGQVDFSQAEEVYRSAYETARKDGVVSSEEEEILATLRESLRLSADAAGKIEAALQTPLGQRPDRSGRWPLVAQNMVYAASIYGWMIPYVLDTEDSKWVVGSEMMSLGASYFLTYRITKHMEISHARAQMMRAGSAMGLAYAYGVNTVLELDRERGKSWAWVVMASVPIGSYVGDRIFAMWHPSHGQAWSLTLWTELGGYSMRQIHHLIQKEPREPQDWKKAHALFSMAGYPLGTYLGHRLFGTRQYTFGDAMMLLQGRWVGWFYGVLTTDALDLDMDDPGGRIIRTLGSGGGMLVFDRVIRGYDYSFGEAALTALGTVSGIAFAVGLSVVSEIDEGRVVDLLAMAGGAAGFYLGNSILTPKTETQTGSHHGGTALSLVPGVFPHGGRLHPAVHLSFSF